MPTTLTATSLASPRKVTISLPLRPPGAQGLRNHGNTCFMNAVVQCLSNTAPLAEFLALGRYRARGGRAEVTHRLAALVRALWTRDYTPQLSAEFKNIVSKHSSQFRGNAQHDALEFLLWLLDRMHQDLGAASPAQQTHRRQEEPSEDRRGDAGSSPPPAQPPRGQSFVQSHFQAQYRSSLTCPHCLKQSNTFDPFLCISLPIPLRQTRALNVTLVLQCERRRFLRVGLAVPLLGTVAELREMVAREGHIPPEQVILAEVSPRGFLRSLGDAEALGAAGEGAPLYAFQPPPLVPWAVIGGKPGDAGGRAAGRGAQATRPALINTCTKRDPLNCPRPAAGCPRSLPASPGAAQRPPPAARSSDCLHPGAGGRILLLLCNTAGDGPRLARFGPPLVLREERGVSWEQLQQSILAQLRALLRGEVRAQGTGALFRIRLAGGSAPCTYLSPQDPRPLCHPAVDRALQLSETGGPPHVKLTVEWDMSTKERLFGDIQEEVVQDAESVRLQQQAHRQQHSCTLDECFQLYTKEEQGRGVGSPPQPAVPSVPRFGPPLVLREERGVSWEQLQQSILAQLRALLRGEVRAQGTGALFRIRLAGGSAPCTYLSPQDPRPLCHPAVDRALQLSETGGPPHVKLTVEWDMSTKERLFGDIQEEVVQDAESVRLQQQAHRQQHSCTLDECFQLYTKEEQVPPALPSPSYCCNALDGRWYSYDDSRVEGVQEAEVGTRSAYILFYQRRHGAAGTSGRAYCCNALDGRWYSYDDSRVEGVQEAEVGTRSAYILFYQRRHGAAGTSGRGEHPRAPTGTRNTGHACAVEPKARGRGVCALVWGARGGVCTRGALRCVCAGWGVHTARLRTRVCTWTSVHGQYGRHIHRAKLRAHTDTHAHACMESVAGTYTYTWQNCMHTGTPRSQSSASLPPRPERGLRRSASLGRGAGGTPMSSRGPPVATLQRGRQPLCRPAVPESSF
ncbi:PREDICTED: ubiquitin carboxyl-terminal hydrolase 43 [Calidris pugnax]|uniref:ubiquitin carboxyl-terminal hydrolase 43 n=1 Tax=Calidris pugnax TaxID=198806 RepID=UPI00071D56ED|nr:PREDICTED: ubiquitin carboxyl-terminal hydrolase 43 [Calidris pugnax]